MNEPKIDTGTAANGETLLHQDYYSAGGIEPAEYIDAWNMNFNLGNVVKYVTRAGRKEGAEDLDDLKKAANYINRELKRRTS